MRLWGWRARADRVREHAAADWFARMRGPDADRLRLEFERWKSSDPRNRAAYAKLDDLWRASAGLAGTQIGRAPVFQRRRPTFAPARPTFALASIAVLATAGASALLLTRTTGSPTPVVGRAASILATGVGEIRSQRLADGSTITLDTDSAIEVGISPKSRILRLIRGRARFDVAQGIPPFSVEAGGRTVTARGTVFDVGLCREGVRVMLIQGLVEVRARGAGAAAAGSRLVAGQTLVVAPRGQRIAASTPGSDQWVKGMLSFDGAPLSSVLEEANRYSAHKLRLADARLGGLRVTGIFRALPTDALAASLGTAFDLRVERVQNGDYLLRSK